MNAAIAARLRDLLERRFAQVDATWRAYDLANRAAHDRAPDAAFDVRDECSDRYAFALIHYRHAFRDERHLAGIWGVAERSWATISRKDPRWWDEHRFESGWKLVHDVEPMPAEVDQHKFEPIRRFHDWVLDQLGVGAATAVVLERYVRGVALFERDAYREAMVSARRSGDRSNADERLACMRMAAWLYAQGLDPVTELQLGDGRADLAVPSGPDAVAVEAKVIRPGDPARVASERINAGIHQARAYAERLNHPTGYVVLFWLDDATFPQRIDERRIGDTTIRVLVVDLRSTRPSHLGGVLAVSVPDAVDGS